jgi:hypothetical protein
LKAAGLGTGLAYYDNRRKNKELTQNKRGVRKVLDKVILAD